jgi:glycosyltransferase involved in cell wall biosynthesis
MTVAVDFAAPPEDLGSRPPIGLRVAIDDFLRAWFAYGEQQPFVFRPQNEAALAHLRALARESGLDPDQHCIALDPRTPQQNLGAIATLFRPDPALADALWTRPLLGSRGFSACGLVHTLSGDQVARTLYDLLLAPHDATDALICPSHAVRQAAQTLLDGMAEDLDARFGGRHAARLQLPVMPLGVRTAHFNELASAERRAAQRAALGLDDDTTLILFAGRLSFVTKAHPLPLLLAVRDAAARAKGKVRLAFFGYFQPAADMEPRFRALIRDLAGDVSVDLITHDDPRFPDGLWAAADVFTSLVDNVQESFGLTPVEAAAAGLPVVVTDWDGYRDSVADGETGFLVPTTMPPAAAGEALAAHFFSRRNYGLYLAGAAQSCAVDIGRAAQAFATLIDDPAKRRAMGQAGAARAQALYDWRVLIPAYRALWADLAERRRFAPRATVMPPSPLAAAPFFPNPYAAFQGFASRLLDAELPLYPGVTIDAISPILAHDMNRFVPELLLPPALLAQLLATVRARPGIIVGDLAGFLPPHEKAAFWRSIGWLLKNGLCSTEADAHGSFSA